jgi:hypothetical protein
MAITRQELYDFTRFAGKQLDNGETATLLDLVRQWELHRLEYKSTDANGAIQIDAKTLQKLAEAFPDVQDEEQLRRSLTRRGGVTTAEMLGKAVLAAARTDQE